MCHGVKCSTCSASFPPPEALATFLDYKLLTASLDKSTWVGCGQHVPGVLDSVAEAERCSCEPQIERSGKMYPPAGSILGGLWGMLGMGGGKKGAEKGKEEL
ncbi:hypothetical protein B0A48_03257 [Cryoendolithus antarcticus]|uniref:Uncharacterized protein n=1 Tax=Cryoendolithus antarcticus TaxID=1507870 RepID=A0A1V8TJH0_9PEZI|nr:hypothetical protein B0A48_03257 [Cryoendolithus antarcticus]